LHPGIQDYGSDSRKTKLQNRRKQSGNIEVALAKIQGRLNISAHDPRKQRQKQIVGDGNNQSPDSLRQNDSNDHAAYPFTSIQGRRFRRGSFRNFIHIVV
jgi:hypothetical protein